jgi:hypothetical protein
MGSCLEYCKDVRIRISSPVPGLLGCIVNRLSFIMSRKYWKPQILETGPVWLCSDVWLGALYSPLVKAQCSKDDQLAFYKSAGSPGEVSNARAWSESDGFFVTLSLAGYIYLPTYEKTDDTMSVSLAAQATTVS